jgi:hypothetical protein
MKNYIDMADNLALTNMGLFSIISQSNSLRTSCLGRNIVLNSPKYSERLLSTDLVKSKGNQ